MNKKLSFTADELERLAQFFEVLARIGQRINPRIQESIQDEHGSLPMSEPTQTNNACEQLLHSPGIGTYIGTQVRPYVIVDQNEQGRHLPSFEKFEQLLRAIDPELSLFMSLR